MVEIQLRVLGPLDVVRGGRAIDVAGPQQRRLLTALLLTPGTVVSTDRLMSALWAESLPRSALKSLHAHISRLRDALGDDDGDVIATQTAGYVLRVAAGQVDAGRFEQLVARARSLTSTRPDAALDLLDEAIGLWRGAAHADFADEAFVRADAVRLEELRLAAAEERAGLLLSAGRHAEAIADLEAFTRRHRLRERPHAQLMVALYREGRQADALQVFRALRSTLADELGLEPSDALQALERDILRREPRLEDHLMRDAREWRAAVGDHPQQTARPAISLRTPAGDAVPMLERDAHLAVLDDMLNGVAVSERGGLAVVRSEAGIGKTTLVRSFCDRHRAATRQLWGVCDALFTPRPLGPLRDVAEAVGRDLLAAVRAGGQPYDVASQLFDDLRATAPTVLVLEDLQWADEATLDVVRLLGRRVGALPVLVVATYRDDEIDVMHPLRRVLGELMTLPTTRELPLERLSMSAVAELSAPRDRDGEQIHAVTAGNPLFVVEVLTSSGDVVPASIRHAVLGRASALEPQARDALDAIAIAPPRVDPSMLEAIADVTAAQIDACLASGIVVAESSGVAFRHELARRAIASAIPAHRAAALHHRAIDAMLSLPPERQDLSRLVHHADAAGEVDAIMRFGRAAAEQAARMGAYREAAAHYARVLRHADRLVPAERAGVLVHYAAACYRTDHNSDAIEAMTQAVALCRQLGDRGREGQALLALAQFLWCPGRTSEAMACARQAVDLLQSMPVSSDLGMAHSIVAQLSMNAEDVDGALTWSRRALDVARVRTDVRIDVHARTNLATIAGLTGDAAAGTMFDECLATAESSERDEDVPRILINRAMSAIRRHEYQIATDALKRAEVWCRDLGHELWLFYVRAYQSVVALDLGDWSRAENRAQLVVRYPRSSTIPRILALTVTALIAGRTGDADPWPSLDLARDLAASTGELERLVPPALARAELAWLAGHRDAVIDATDEPLRLAIERGATWMIGPLASWRWRAGIATEAPDGLVKPYALQAAGRHHDVARWWLSRGCRYSAALSLLDAADDASNRQASRIFEDLGTRAVTRAIARTSP